MFEPEYECKCGKIHSLECEEGDQEIYCDCGRIITVDVTMTWEVDELCVDEPSDYEEDYNESFIDDDTNGDDEEW